VRTFLRAPKKGAYWHRISIQIVKAPFATQRSLGTVVHCLESMCAKLSLQFEPTTDTSHCFPSWALC
jgi:hypothetical protein